MVKGKFKNITIEMKKKNHREATRKWRLKKILENENLIEENKKLREALKNEKLRFLLNETNK